MLNRRYLRTKVFQSLYAYWQDDAASAAHIEKELVSGIRRLGGLYLALLLALAELRHVALQRIDERRHKRLPTPEDLSPNRRFVDNPLLERLAADEHLLTECQRSGVSWVGEREHFVRIFKELERSEAYAAYMRDPEPTFAKHRAFAVHVLTEHIANDEGLQDVFESRSIHWLEDLDLAASLAKRTLELATPDSITVGEPRWETGEEAAFAARLFRETIAHGQEHETAIAARASNWDSDRIALSDMILMKMALTEARIFEEIPVKVTLNEYIEIAKAYSTPKSKNFINGVLDRLFLDMKADGRIRKVGRGLLES